MAQHNLDGGRVVPIDTIRSQFRIGRSHGKWTRFLKRLASLAEGEALMFTAEEIPNLESFRSAASRYGRNYGLNVKVRPMADGSVAVYTEKEASNG